MIHASKRAFVAVKNHRDAYGRFAAGDIVIVDDEAVVALLIREGSIDPAIVVDASMYLDGPPAVATPKGDGTPVKSRDRMVRAPSGRRGRAKPEPALPDDGTRPEPGPNADQDLTAEASGG